MLEITEYRTFRSNRSPHQKAIDSKEVCYMRPEHDLQSHGKQNEKMMRSLKV